MDKTLETVVLVHRLTIIVALALFIAGVSVHRPDRTYDYAEGELLSLEDAIQAASEQVNTAYKAIYDKSELKASALAWLRLRNSAQQKIDIQVPSAGDFAIPDPARNPLVTLEAQVKWADRAYLHLDSPFLLCAVDRGQVFQALDRLFSAAAKPTFKHLNIHLRRATAGPDSNQQFQCEVELEYETQVGTLIGLQSTMLDLPTTVVNVTQVEPPGPKWIDLEIADTLKEHGLGDFEALHGLHIPSLREFWTDLGSRPPAAAIAFLEHKKREEAEKAKEKIEILGQSLSGSLTIMLATVVELFLMVYLLAHLMQVRATLPGHEAAVSESPFFGIMHTGLGRLVMLSTLFIIPFGVCIFVLMAVFPSFQAEWHGPRWVVGSVARWALIGAVGMTGLLLVRNAYGTMTVLVRTVRLTAKGATKAEEAIKNLSGS